MKEPYKTELAKYVGEQCLNIGCGDTPEPGWVNVDFNSPKADRVFDLRDGWPLPDNQFDTVLASHVLEHFRDEDLFHIMYEIGRVLKPGGFLIGVVPYATHHQHFANPFHKQPWTETTPGQFDRRLYEKPNCASTGADQKMELHAWDYELTRMVPDERWAGASQEVIERAMYQAINVIKELLFVLELAE